MLSMGSDDFAGVQRDSSDLSDERHFMLTLPHEKKAMLSILLLCVKVSCFFLDYFHEIM